MIKKTITIISISAAVLGSYALSLPVFASEISGTVSTDGTYFPSNTRGSSEISGVITMANGTEPSPSPSPSPTPTPAPTYNYYPSTPGDAVMSGTVVGGVDDTAAANDTAHYTMDLSEFGARYGGGSGYPLSSPGLDTSLAYATGFGPNSSNGSLARAGGTDSEEGTLLPPFAGGVFGNSASPDLTASALGTPLGKSGLSTAQLSYIAFIGVILIASMGYAISRTSRRMM